MNILKLELKKTNIKPYFLSAIAVFVCIMGLTYILAWVPHLDSGDKMQLSYSPPIKESRQSVMRSL